MNLTDLVKNETEAKQALIGTILADGCIEKQRTPNGRAYCEITHTMKNLDYLKFKKQLFEIIPECLCTIESHNKKTEDKTYNLFRLRTNKHDWLTQLRSEIYTENRIKLFRKEYIDSMSLIGLLLMYLDDGTLRVRYYEGSDKVREMRVTFCLDSFTKNELEYFQKYLKSTYDIDTKMYRHSKMEDINRGFRIWTNTTNTKKFMDLIAPFYGLIPSMSYKFTKFYNLS